MLRDFHKIKAWQFADDLAFEVYSATDSFPHKEQFGLTSQMRRAAVSVAANIAEGASRRSKKDYFHFLNLAESSLAELGYYIHFSGRLKYISDEINSKLMGLYVETSKTLYGLIQAVKVDLAQEV